MLPEYGLPKREEAGKWGGFRNESKKVKTKNQEGVKRGGANKGGGEASNLEDAYKENKEMRRFGSVAKGEGERKGCRLRTSAQARKGRSKDANK